MEKTKKKARIWILVLALIVVIGGICFYLYGMDRQNLVTDGTLISKMMISWRKLCQ